MKKFGVTVSCENRKVFYPDGKDIWNFPKRKKERQKEART